MGFFDTEKGVEQFNKILVGAGCKTDDNGNVIIPTLPYLDAKNRECIQYMPFANYTTGEKFPDTAYAIPYWKPLNETLDDYADHKETKSDGDIGELKRKHLLINKFSIRYIGKESNELEESDIVGVTDGNYAKYLNLREVILGIDVYKDHKKIGVSKSNLFELQKKAKNGEKLKPQKETLSKIWNPIKNKK